MTAEQFIEKMRVAGQLPLATHPAYGDKLSEHIAAGIDHVVSPDTGEFWIHKPLMLMFDTARELLAKPIRITAGSRTAAHERALAAKGYKTARFISPHCLSALDCEATGTGNKELQDAFRAAATECGFPKPRLGHVTYEERFTHVDMVFLFFAPYTDLPHPRDWSDLETSMRIELGGAWQPGIQW